jgi:hypothetical protein
MSIVSLRLRLENLQNELDCATDRDKKRRIYKRLITLQNEIIGLHIEELRELSAEIDPDNYDAQKTVNKQLRTVRIIKFDQFLLAILFAVITASCLFVAIETGTKSFWFATFGTLTTTAWFVISGVRENKKPKRG